MKSADRTLWLEALRSGNFDQAKSALAISESESENIPVAYCCLGVLCEIKKLVHLLGDDLRWIYYDTDSDGYTSQSSTVIPHTLARSMWIGSNPTLITLEEQGFFDTKMINHGWSVSRFQRQWPDDLVELHLPFNRQGQTESLASLNDEGFTFEQIADLIERFIPSEEDDPS